MICGQPQKRTSQKKDRMLTLDRKTEVNDMKAMWNFLNCFKVELIKRKLIGLLCSMVVYKRDSLI